MIPSKGRLLWAYWKGRLTLGFKCRVMCWAGLTSRLRYLDISSQRTMPSKQGKPWLSGLRRAVSLNTLWVFQSSTLSVPTSMRWRLCFGLSMASPPTSRPGYIPRNPLICSQPCKWLNKLVRGLPMFTKMTNVTVKDP